jgi:hypothetical protein
MHERIPSHAGLASTAHADGSGLTNLKPVVRPFLLFPLRPAAGAHDQQSDDAARYQIHADTGIAVHYAQCWVLRQVDPFSS